MVAQAGFSTQLTQQAARSLRQVTQDEWTLLAESPNVVLVDVRDRQEWAEGHLPQALCVPRGMLEFYLDPASSFHHPGFSATDGKLYVFYCGIDGRAVLAAEVARQHGLDVAYLEGGFKGWRASGRRVVLD